MKNKPTILETTLRDGSYAINFAFTAADTAVIAKGLETVGFEYIEVGHGAGLSASRKGHGTAVETDEDYMIAAAEALKKSKYGMFCIPGIAELEDVDLAAKNNMGFIRIGTNVTEVEKSEKFIEKAKKHKMMVAANYMKSYVLSPKEFAQKVKLSEKYGADVVYIVDSAGGMFSDSIKEYYEAIREVSEIPIGFHGHNNLGLAVHNSIEAVKMGCSFVDSSLQGMGRSSGNACTEMLVAALEKMGYSTQINLLQLLKLGPKFIQPLYQKKGEMPLDVISGFSDFHSSYMPLILKCAAKYHVEPEELIIEACKVSKVDVKKEDLEKIAQRLKKNEELFVGQYNIQNYAGREQEEV